MEAYRAGVPGMRAGRPGDFRSEPLIVLLAWRSSNDLCPDGFFGLQPSCHGTCRTLIRPDTLIVQAACPAGWTCPAGTLELPTRGPCVAPPGSYCPLGVPGTEAGISCPVQYFCPGGEAQKQLCSSPPGFSCFPEGCGNSSGQMCAGGSFCVGGITLPRLCPSAAYCPVSSACSICFPCDARAKAVP